MATRGSGFGCISVVDKIARLRAQSRAPFYAVARRSLRRALRSKNSAWLMTAETAAG
jgi:hypothetical protein